MCRHSFLLALALPAVGTSHAQSTVPATTQQNQNYSCSALGQGAAIVVAAKPVEVRAGLTASYYDVMIGVERQRLARELLGLVGTSSEMTARRVTAGEMSPVE